MYEEFEGNMAQLGFRIPSYPELVPFSDMGGLDPTEPIVLFWEDLPETQELDPELLQPSPGTFLVMAPNPLDLHPEYGLPQYYVYQQGSIEPLRDQNGQEVLWSPDQTYNRNYKQIMDQLKREELMARASRPIAMSVLEASRSEFTYERDIPAMGLMEKFGRPE
jgi:hypothetical protein